MALEIDKNKIMNLSESLKDAVKSPTQTTSDGWMGIAKEALEFIKELPQGLAMVKGVLEDVKEVQRAPKEAITTEPMKEGSVKGKVISLGNEARAENIFNQIIGQADKFKLMLATMNGAKLLEMLKNNKPMVVQKIKEELEK
jgi:hypothetical protein